MQNTKSHPEDECSLSHVTFDEELKPQSGMEKHADGTTNDNSIIKLSGSSKHENVKFADQADPYLYDVDSFVDSTRRLQDSSDAMLENFFSRPIKIAEEEWGTGTTLGFQINPWSLYFNNPRVINRLANFNLLRCNLKVKIVINGNGFQYGRLLVSYLPFVIFDTLSSNAALVRQDLVQASQQPHLFLDPTTSQGGEMKLPFYNYLNYCKVPTAQWAEMGIMYFRTLNALKHANGASDKVTVSVFAWAEDVSMSVLTSTEPTTITPQSGKEVDEVNTKGFISGPATAVAKAARAMSSVPYIKPYAQATDIAATATASVAKMFGYCRPVLTKDPEPFKPKPTSSLALTNVGDGVNKLTVDDKQELSIDPRISGLGGMDALNIKEIAKRESYLTTFDWAIGTAPETLLWNARVDPCTWAQNTGPPVSYHFPACAMAALPFKYWTGSMRFRFQIVCSSFHKGRIKVVYDPNALSSNEYNTNYLNIIDIADQTDFTVEIANGQDKTLLTHSVPGVNSVTEMYSTTPYTGINSWGNGVIGVYVVNELTVPNSTINNDIQVNVFVSMGDDFEVFVPDDHIQRFVFKPQSGLEVQSGMEQAIVPEAQNTNEPSAPQHDDADLLGPTISDNSDINKVFTGEAITSFRTMLKRYNLWNAVGFFDTVPVVISGRFSAFPMLRGNVAGAVDLTGAGAPYNYVNTVLLHWVTLAFSGWRGSIRYKIVPRGPVDDTLTYYIQRHATGEQEYLFSTAAPLTAVNRKQAGNAIIDQGGATPTARRPFIGMNGQVYQTGKINNTVEIEIPYYSQYRFTPGKEENHTGINNFNEGWDYRIQGKGSAETMFDIHVAAGEDFQTYFFTGLPRMYYEASTPAT